MTKLDNLIKELCPDGVEYKTIGETVGVNRGKRLVKSQLSDNGAYEVYHGSKESILGRYDQYNEPANNPRIVYYNENPEMYIFFVIYAES